MGLERGWELVEAPTLDSGGARVSSARTRELVASGQLDTAATLLGRPFALVGTVVHGEQRGRELGFPTANLSFSGPACLPPDGIYAARATWGGEAILSPLDRADAVISLGTQPTFGGRVRLFEVHLLDRDVDLYGTRLRVEFAGWLRGQRRYDSADELIAQMGRDVAHARTVLLEGFASCCRVRPAPRRPPTRVDSSGSGGRTRRAASGHAVRSGRGLAPEPRPQRAARARRGARSRPRAAASQATRSAAAPGCSAPTRPSSPSERAAPAVAAQSASSIEKPSATARPMASGIEGVPKVPALASLPMATAGAGVEQRAHGRAGRCAAGGPARAGCVATVLLAARARASSASACSR